MSLTQFSMVEELACLVKDNLSCKHLVLSVEDMLVDFLQDETREISSPFIMLYCSLDKVLEMEPMNPYNRLLLHRLADIFGFSHQSIGEGDDRRLVLKRCEDTSIPSILVADMLWEHDDYHSPVTSQQLLSRRHNVSAGARVETLSARISLEDREAAYLAARKRIFSTDNDDMELLFKEERPRNNPVVARRMIAHALGQKVKQSNQDIQVKDAQEPASEVKSQLKGQNTGSSFETNPKSNGQQRVSGNNEMRSIRKTPSSIKVEASTNVNVPKHYVKEEHIGAAKRMFANALRMHPGKVSVVSKGGQTKQKDKP